MRVMARMVMFSGCLALSAGAPRAGADAAVFDGVRVREVARVTLAGAEIAAFDAASNVLLVTCTRGVAVVHLGRGDDAALVRVLTPHDLAPEMSADEPDITHVCIDPAGRGFGVALLVPADYSGVQGRAVFFGARTGAPLGSVVPGFNPDSAALTQDGTALVIANEGQPSVNDRGVVVDPPGSVTVIDLRRVRTERDLAAVGRAQVTTVYFDDAALRGAMSSTRTGETPVPPIREADEGERTLRIHPRNALSPSLDLEPEYVAIAGRRAYITLQENNAIAEIEIDRPERMTVHALDTPRRALDGSDRDGAAKPTGTIRALRMPDQAAVLRIDGRSLLLCADEGDDRGGWGEELGDKARVAALAGAGRLSEHAGIDIAETALGRLQVCTFTGDVNGDGVLESPAALGARSLSIWDCATMDLVGDTGSQFEQHMAALADDSGGGGASGGGGLGPCSYNADSDEPLNADARSDDRGCEPEGVAVVTVGARTLALVTLEKPGALALVDVGETERPRVIGVFDAASVGLTAPEGVLWIEPEHSPTGTGLAVVCFEGSGHVGLFEVSVSEQ